VRRIICALVVGVALFLPARTAAGSQEKNAQAFLFMLEFGMGAPFTDAQERVILDELLAGWRTRSAEELQKFDAYPQLVGLLMSMGQNDLAELRKSVEETVRAWLAESPAGDPAVKAVQDQLARQGKVLVAGEPPLTEMAATAYSEMVVFARILRDNPRATLEQIKKEAVSEVRRDVLRAWTGFAVEERQSLATAPALWITMRKVLRFGSREEQEHVRAQLLKLASAPGDKETPGPSAAPGKPLVNSLVMSQIKQTTFNTYMWSRGFQGWTPTGKI
jgi:hypothetical protein